MVSEFAGARLWIGGGESLDRLRDSPVKSAALRRFDSFIERVAKNNVDKAKESRATGNARDESALPCGVHRGEHGIDR
jgi:hypothetical protein